MLGRVPAGWSGLRDLALWSISSPQWGAPGAPSQQRDGAEGGTDTHMLASDRAVPLGIFVPLVSLQQPVTGAWCFVSQARVLDHDSCLGRFLTTVGPWSVSYYTLAGRKMCLVPSSAAWTPFQEKSWPWNRLSCVSSKAEHLVNPFGAGGGEGQAQHADHVVGGHIKHLEAAVRAGQARQQGAVVAHCQSCTGARVAPVVQLTQGGAGCGLQGLKSVVGCCLGC